MTVIVHPDKDAITIYRRPSPPVTVGSDEDLDLGTIFAGLPAYVRLS